MYPNRPMSNGEQKSVFETTPVKVVVHPGGAHRDEFLAAAVILGKFPGTPVFRENPTPEELTTPAVWVVDQGGESAPERGNFDHHQLTADSPATCALTLVLRALELETQARQAWDWLAFTEVLDSKGPPSAAKLIGAPWGNLKSALSPVELLILAEFGKVRGEVTGLLKELMQRLGTALVAQLEQFQVRQDLLTAGTKVLTVRGLKVLVTPAEIRGSSLVGVSEWKAAHHADAAVSVVPSDRDPGVGLYRFDDHPRVDFRRLAGGENILFSHANGFFACTKTVPAEEELIKLLETAIE